MECNAIVVQKTVACYNQTNPKGITKQEFSLTIQWINYPKIYVEINLSYYYRVNGGINYLLD